MEVGAHRAAISGVTAQGSWTPVPAPAVLGDGLAAWAAEATPRATGAGIGYTAKPEPLT